ncbi:unnamed protein product [Spirodela intermedia]|uniref:Uncharacterized protein n=1 Tax=Spirodela intermedia TaxID=51605 RepID=A0A7I8J234_SPIIN|nr:unnamed protein product [Spirodela intermedia]CAA6664032.1 unnamed protein product [Spirodela intermedia]
MSKFDIQIHRSEREKTSYNLKLTHVFNDG